MELTKLECFYKKHLAGKSYYQISKLLDHGPFETTFDSQNQPNPFEKSIDLTPEHLLITYYIAMKLEPASCDNGMLEDTKAAWQRYWLKCCINKDCDYFFAVFSDLNNPLIDREDDIVKIMNEGLIFKHLNSKTGEHFYLERCERFLLSKYAWGRAAELHKKHPFSIMSFLNLRLPRLLGTVAIGFLPLITSAEVWKFPMLLINYNTTLYWALFVVMAGISYIYLFIECGNAVGKTRRREVMKRSIAVFIWGISWSTLFSALLVFILVGPVCKLEESDKLVTAIIFSISAFLIGIFIQVFWEDKTVTEPL